MGTGVVRLEDSNGQEVSNPSEAQIRETIAAVGTDIEHCILHLSDDSFVQTAGDRDRLLIEYSDSNGFFESGRVDFDAETVANIFAEAMNGNHTWKTEYNFSRSGEPSGSGGAESGRGGASGSETSGTRPGERGGAIPGEHGHGGHGTASMGGSLKDKVIGQVKREVGREATYGLNSIIRRVMRTIFGGRRF